MLFSRLKLLDIPPRSERVDSPFQLRPAIRSVGPDHRLPIGREQQSFLKLKTARPGKLQNFSFIAPGATSVLLAGCFTDWLQRPIKLRKKSNGVWWTGVRLQPGTYYYRFLVDGRWRDDPECSLFVPNPFGCQNAVRQVY